MTVATTRRGTARGTFIVFGSMIVLLVSLATPAGAYTFTGCRYDSASISPIQYRFYSVTSSYVTAFQNAQAAWDGTSSPGYFGENSTSLDPEIPVHDGAYSGT